MFSFRGSSPRWKNRSKPSHACSGWVVLPLLLKHQPDGHVPWSWVSAPLRDLFVGMKEFNWQERPTLPPKNTNLRISVPKGSPGPSLAGPLWLPGPHGEEPRGRGADLALGARGPVVPVEDSSVLLSLLAGMKTGGNRAELGCGVPRAMSGARRGQSWVSCALGNL